MQSRLSSGFSLHCVWWCPQGRVRSLETPWERSNPSVTARRAVGSACRGGHPCGHLCTIGDGKPADRSVALVPEGLWGSSGCSTIAHFSSFGCGQTQALPVVGTGTSPGTLSHLLRQREFPPDQFIHSKYTRQLSRFFKKFTVDSRWLLPSGT